MARRMAKGRSDPNRAGFLRGRDRGWMARALRSKIGRVCWFKHPETGKVIEGTYQRGRKVVQMTGMSRLEEKDGHGRGFNVDETTWTVPRQVKITFGQAPAEGGA